MINKEQAKADALKFLKENVTAVVATTFDGEPRASTVYYCVDDDFNFYFITKRTTSKYLFTRIMPLAAVVVGFGPEHIEVQAHGVVELVTDDDERQNIWKKFVEAMTKEHVKTWPIDEMQHLKGVSKIIMKVVPQKVLFMNLDSTTYPDSHSNEYVVIR